MCILGFAEEGGLEEQNCEGDLAGNWREFYLQLLTYMFLIPSIISLKAKSWFYLSTTNT